MNLRKLIQTEGDHKLIKLVCTHSGYKVTDRTAFVKFFEEELKTISRANDDLTIGLITHCMIEAAGNAMYYGKKGGFVEIRYKFDDKIFKASIKDDGNGFDVADWKKWYNKLEVKYASNALTDESTMEHYRKAKLLKTQYPNASIRGSFGRISGIGLYHIHAFMDRVDFNNKGNEITMYKNLSNDLCIAIEKSSWLRNND